MQGKGIVKFFLVVMTIVTLIQYLFIVPTQKVERAATRYADELTQGQDDEQLKHSEHKKAVASYLDSMSKEKISTIFGSFTYENLKSRQLALGLDLKGGMSMVLEVDLREFIIAMASGNNKKIPSDPTFIKALEEAVKAKKSAQTDFITLFGNAYSQVKTGDDKLSRIFQKNEALRDEIDFTTTDAEVIRILRKKADETVGLTYDLLKQRIDKMGVIQPNVSLDKERDLITVELPGVENPERAKSYIQAAAKLEFWNVYRIDDPGVIAFFSQANEKLRATEGTEVKTTTRIDTITTIDSLGNQVSQIDTVEVSGAVQGGPLFEVFSVNQSGALGLATMGVADGNKKTLIDTMLARPEIISLFPGEVVFRWEKDPINDPETGEETDQYRLYALKVERDGQPPLTGEHVTDASVSPDPTDNSIAVTLNMDGVGTRDWGKMTTAAAQDNNRQIAILLDDAIVSAPRVINPILRGNTQITGNFSMVEATDLANILKIGKLPVSTEVVQSALVGPSLGAANINSSKWALIVGFSLVLIFMMLYYGGAGIVSIIALLLNVFFIFGALASYGTVLTLPGIAGIILTIGMAVDANVIIFERIREELEAGKTLLTAIKDGFNFSYSAIIDANVTTIITAIVLAYFGLGPIKGFAVVLIIGVLSSLFTAVLVGRLLIDSWTKKGRTITFGNSYSKGAFKDLKIDWIGGRKKVYIFSGLLILISLGAIFMRGFELGIDFKGGYSYNVAFAQGVDVDVESLRANLKDAFEGKAPTVKAVDEYNTYNVVTDYKKGATKEELGVDPAVMVMDQLFVGVQGIAESGLTEADFKNPDALTTHVSSSSSVGATIADDIQKSALEAGILALIFIFLYIFIRFSKWQYSTGAVAALFHDTIIVLGVFALFHGVFPFAMEIDQAFIAAILTVIGYSINDTVVVFDRIREYQHKYLKEDNKSIFNAAINSTISRTVITSLTTFFVVAVLFFFGGSSIKGFSFALLVGILVGTYSSIFIATPIMLDLGGDVKVKEKSSGNRAAFSKAAENAK